MSVVNPTWAETIVPLWIALSVAVLIAGIAWRTQHLSRGGALAAVCVGTAALHAQLSWGVVLITWFAATSLLSRWQRERKWARTATILAKNDQRDAWQVIANGGVFAVLAVLTILVRWYAVTDGRISGGPDDHSFDDSTAAMTVTFAVAAAGALAAAAADTFATEIGTLARAEPRSIRSWQLVPAGTSGAITAIGTIASIAGAVLVALCATVVGLTPIAAMPAIVMAGILGSLVDTFLGAWLQARRWCPQCEAATERSLHNCATPTIPHAGIAWLNNDVVNVLCTITGAVIAVVAWR